VNARIAAYEKQGVIRGYQAILNEDKLDLDTVTAVIEVKVTPQREGGFNTIAERISKSFGSVSKRVLPIRMYVAGGDALNCYTGARISEDVDAILSRDELKMNSLPRPTPSLRTSSVPPCR